MAKFCSNCGAELADDAVFCLSCGIVQPTAAPQPVVRPVPQAAPAVQPQPAVQPAQPEAAPAKKRKFPVRGVCISVAVLVALVAVFMIFSIFFARPYQDAVDNYVRIFLLGDTEYLEDAAPEEFWDWYAEFNSTTVTNLLTQAENAMAPTWEFYQSFVGENLRFAYDYHIVTQYSRQQVDMMAEDLEKRYEIDAESVTDAYHLYLDVTIKGENGNMTKPGLHIYLVEIDGNWYPFTYSAGLDGIYLQFAVRSTLYYY